MTAACKLYCGEVLHARVRPKRHKLHYRVFSFLFDTAEIGAMDRGLRLFSYNRFNLFSFYDRDHGPGDGTPVYRHACQLFANAGIDVTGGRVLLLAYPRVLGYVFNPLSIYFGIAADGRLAGLVYEVNNTWGERRSYVLPAGEPVEGVYGQQVRKALFVSPFASPTGRYAFRVTAPNDSLLAGVAFHDTEGALIRTHFRGYARQISDRALAGLLISYPLFTLKVIGAIHWEALKLWLKGVPLAGGTSAPGYHVTYKDPAEGAKSHGA